MRLEGFWCNSCTERAKTENDKSIAECLICCVKGYGHFYRQNHLTSVSCVDKTKNEENPSELNH